MHYFTKWIEAEALATITEKLGIPRTIITDNGTQFQGKFKWFYANFQIALTQSLVKTPQTNG
ncbi:rve domain-containing protein [Gossypium australe]|uniref:Rve domain-containing protein n=1 Tax=Gossypium australe TaxID=47621 RepID=A0A5B6WPF4_9ROSI|nr:rve domain-containing protein [Gossypium australe]